MLIHDVAYRSLPKAQRARAHAEVGAWLEELAGDRLEEFAALLAYHYGAAAAEETAELAWPEPVVRREVRAKAFDHLLQAGAAARRRFAVAKAVELHEQAGTLAATEGERRRVLEALGDDQSSAFHSWPEACRPGCGGAAARPLLEAALSGYERLACATPARRAGRLLALA